MQLACLHAWVSVQQQHTWYNAQLNICWGEEMLTQPLHARPPLQVHCGNAGERRAAAPHDRGPKEQGGDQTTTLCNAVAPHACTLRPNRKHWKHAASGVRMCANERGSVCLG